MLKSEDICNLEKDFKSLTDFALNGDHIVFYGRRNMGKTSLILAKVIPEFIAKKQNPIVLFVDFLGVQNESEVYNRLKFALEQGLSKAFPTLSKLKNIARNIIGLRPTIEMDALTGNLALSLSTKTKSTDDLHVIFSEIKRLTKSNSVFIVFDEFQDIVQIKGMDAKIRGEMQMLPARIPTIIMGSKKHLLAQLFSLASAPLAGWGRDYEISTITPEEFTPYLNLRFKPFQKKIALDQTAYLCKIMDFIPEAIINVCITLCKLEKVRTITNKDIDLAVAETIDSHRGRFEESLQMFTKAERVFICELARLQPVKTPSGKEFIHATKLSSAGLIKVAKRLEDLAILYRSKEGLSLSDPLLSGYIRKYW